MRVAAARAIDKTLITTAVSASRSDDEFDVFVADGRGSGSYARRRNAGHAQASALVSVLQPATFAPGRRGSVRMTLIGQARRQELPGTALDPTPSDRIETTRLVPVLELSGETEKGAWRIRSYGRRDDQSLRAIDGTFALPHDRE